MVGKVGQTAREGAIGLVAFSTHRGERAEAVLDGDGVWHCPVLPVLDRVLNGLHDPKRGAVGDVPYGYAELIRVASWLNGVVRIHRP